MAFQRRWLLVLFALVLSGGPLSAASTREQRAYAVAVADFQHEMWGRAETEFGQFASKYKESTNAPMALLLEAQAQFKQGKFTDAIALLAAAVHQAKTGTLADQYVYWIGEAQFQNGDFADAAETWIGLAQKFPESPSRLRAVVEAAAAFGQMTNWSKVDDLLGNTNGVFQRAAQLDPGNELVVAGQLSLENSKFQQRDFPGVAAVYELLTNQWQTLNQVQQCQGTYLFYRAKMGLGDFTVALAATTNLVQIASSPTNQSWLATGWASQGAALKQMDRLPQAVQAWQNNLTNAPVKQKREAILEIAELEFVQGQLTNAEEALTNFLAQFPEAISADIALLTAGELHLKDFAAQPEATNQFSAARNCFDQFLRVSTNSPLLGKAYLDRGWCRWLAKDTTNSLDDFQKAANLLPPSEDLAVARFKTGDAMFALTNYAGALENYRAVLDDFTNFTAVAATLGDRALYQSLRACLELNDLSGASNAVAQILKQYPASGLAPDSALLYGEGLADARQPAAAREQLQQFAAQFPDTPLRPELEFAIARTYELEQSWPAAIAGYQGWLKDFPTNDLRPQAVYALALANSQAGNETNAFGLFTSFVAQFPTNDLAPQAQWWIAGYFFGLGGTNYVDAEMNYQMLYQNTNWQSSPLVYQAQMMAGRAAMGRQGYNDAINHFKALTSDTNCPPDLNGQALFAYGSALMLLDSPGTNNLANFQLAAKVFGQLDPTNELRALALIEIGNCNLQLTNYDEATNAYAQVVSSTNASVSARSQAQVGIGIALDKKAALATGTNQIALLKMARDNYLDVFDSRIGQYLRDGETADPLWVQKAGLAAARLEESLQEWPQALDYYRDLTNAWPSLQAALENKIETIVREHPEAGKN
jgi:TolA-binding protein